MWWWSRISTISACSTPGTLCACSAWSTSSTRRGCGFDEVRARDEADRPPARVDGDRRAVVDVLDLLGDVGEQVVGAHGERLAVHQRAARRRQRDHARRSRRCPAASATTAVPRSRGQLEHLVGRLGAVAGHQQPDAELDRRALRVRRGCRRRPRRPRRSPRQRRRRPSPAPRPGRRPRARRRPRPARPAAPRRSRSTARRRVELATPRATRGCSGGRARARSSRPRARRRRRRSAPGRGPRAPSSRPTSRTGSSSLGQRELARASRRARAASRGAGTPARAPRSLEHPARLRVERRRGAPARSRCGDPAAASARRSRSRPRSSRCPGCGGR